MLRNRSSFLLPFVLALVLTVSACANSTPTSTPTARPANTEIPSSTPTAAATVAATTPAATAAATTPAATAAATTPAATAAAATTAAPTEAATTPAATKAAAATTAAPTEAATTPAATKAAATESASTPAATKAVAAASTPTEAATKAAATTAPATTAAPTEAATTPAATKAATEAPATKAATAVAAATEVATAAAATTAAATPAPTEAATPIGACRATGELIVGSDASYPPFENVNTSNNKIEGFDVDLLAAIGAKAGFTPKFINATFDTIFANLANNQFDLVASAATITEERLKTVSFSNPYFNAGQVIVVRKDDTSIKTVADLVGKTIGVQTNTTGAEAAKDIRGATLRGFQLAPDAFQALSNKDVDAVVNDNVTAFTILLNRPELNLKIVGDPFTTEYYGFAVRQPCADLLGKVNEGLAAVIADGTYGQLYKKYFGDDPSKPYQKGGKGLLIGDVLAPTAVPSPEATSAATPAAATATPAATSVATATPAATAAPTAAATKASVVVPAVVAARIAADATAVPTEAATPEATPVGPCRATGELVVGSDASYPPFENVNTSNNKIEGFDVDLMTAIGAKAGFTPKFINATFDTIFANLANNQFDIVVSAATITEERLKTVSFSNPYFTAGQVIVVRKDDTVVKTAADLVGKTIGVQTNTTGAEAAKDIKGATLRSFQLAPDAFQALANKDVDAVVNDNVTAITILLNRPELNLKIVGDPFTVEYYGVAVRQPCTDLLSKVNEGLAAVIADGTYAQLYKKYFGDDPAAQYQKGGKGLLIDDVMKPEATPEATASK